MKKIVLSTLLLFFVMSSVNIANAFECSCGCQQKCQCECCKKGNCDCDSECKCHTIKCNCKNCKCKCPVCKKTHKFFFKKQIKCNCNK